MRTTVSILQSDIAFIKSLALRKQCTTTAAVLYLMNCAVSKQKFQRRSFYSLVKYRPRSKLSDDDLVRLHLFVDELFAGLKCDVRSIFKVSLSYLISLAIEEMKREINIIDGLDKYNIINHSISFISNKDEMVIEIRWKRREQVRFVELQ